MSLREFEVNHETAREKTLADEATAGTEGASGAAASAETGDKSDYRARIEAGGSFAWEQNQLHQSRADKSQGAEEKHKELESQVGTVKALIDEFGSGVVATVFDNYRTIRNSQELGEVIQSFETTGQLSARKGSGDNGPTDDEYLTEEEKTVRALQAELQDVKQRVSNQTHAAAQGVLKQHMEKVVGDFAIPPESAEKMREAVISQVNQWRRLGDVGEKAIAAMMTEGGYGTIKGIMLGVVDPKDLLAAAQNQDLRKREGLDELTTESPGGSTSTGREPPPTFGSGADGAIKAAQWANMHPNEHGSR